MRKLVLWAALAASLFASGAFAASIIRTDDSVGQAGAAYQVGPIVNLTTAVTTTSDVLEMRVLSGMGVQVDHGNIVGTLVVQESNDDTTYYTAQDVTFAAISGVGGEFVDISSLRARYVRFVYTHSSGTGTLKITPYVKGR